ncbi:hypothetical protein [Sediminibacillus halophilus]|uniref:Uncharacterized protein n=1 Tax=Sediminibacillus halophilus TaxID=482461 RepID=A0A1G9RLY2_9BACI|nr:hypothetical protein [Sediminibacillus halophilus]SDM24224.1 hypothetical protein SAMN05216244_2044 [Sediminibacillus halophilus]
MKEVILLLADIVNRIHDALIERFGLTMTDKQLHFWVIGIIGIFAFFIVYFFFKLIASMKWSITILSFIYTFTMMVVLVFAIELQQALTGGDMEFADAVVGLWGFLVFFFIYVVIALIILAVIKFMRRKK